MLLNLHVRNLALIEDAEVDFGPGLNILTGETGAGKSILLGSVQLILGAKAKKELIRQGKDSAGVELLFQTEDATASALEAMGIQTEDGQVILSRKIMDTRSICRINGDLRLFPHLGKDDIAALRFNTAGIDQGKLLVQPLDIRVDSVPGYTGRILYNSEVLAGERVE